MSGRAGYLKKGKVGVCIMCRQTFQCARMDKKTCSDRCRKAWQRYQNDIKTLDYVDKLEAAQMERLTALIKSQKMNSRMVQS